jgi:hypothetical protein
MDPSKPSIIQQPCASIAFNSREENSTTDSGVSSISNLLQIANAPSGSLIQVPADVLATLLTSLEDLKKEVTLIRHTVTIQETRVAAVESAIGVEFTLFPKLPFELRRIIWNLAFDVPHIVGITWNLDEKEYADNLIPVGPYSPLLWVSRESRHETQKRSFSLDWNGRVHTNPATDIVWMLAGVKGHDAVFKEVYDLLDDLIWGCKPDIPKTCPPLPVQVQK